MSLGHLEAVWEILMFKSWQHYQLKQIYSECYFHWAIINTIHRELVFSTTILLYFAFKKKKLTFVIRKKEKDAHLFFVQKTIIENKSPFSIWMCL